MQKLCSITMNDVFAGLYCTVFCRNVWYCSVIASVMCIVCILSIICIICTICNIHALYALCALYAVCAPYALGIRCTRCMRTLFTWYSTHYITYLTCPVYIKVILYTVCRVKMTRVWYTHYKHCIPLHLDGIELHGME